MNAFFWSRRKPVKELVLKADELLSRMFPDDQLTPALAPKHSDVARESGDGAIAPMDGALTEDEQEHDSEQRELRDGDDSQQAEGDASDDATDPPPPARERLDSTDVAEPEEPNEASDQSSDDDPSAAEQTLPEELERLWAKIRSAFQTWDEDQVDRERKMARMAELLLRYRVLERIILPKVLAALTFETRKYVSHVFRAMTVHNCHGFIEYMADRPEILKWLVEGYKTNSTALICGSMLRDCLEHEALAVVFLRDMPVEFELLFKVTMTNANFDISADAFMNIHKALMGHKTVTVECLNASFDRIFGHLNGLLSSPNYVTKRQALQLLAELLLDPINFSVMQRYISSRNNLKIVMMLLREPSQALRMDAFHVFKIFVANPNKSNEVEQLLARNREKLLAFVCDFGKNETNRDFQQEKSLLVFTLQRMVDKDKAVTPMFKASTSLPSSTGSDGNPSPPSSTSPASPALTLRKSISDVCGHHDG